ncbi:DUF29 domain-containing protein [Acidithiobacillus ferrooxidans]|uniref:DUF29 domain-containing protein n=1 Tax=Acidithiobacillus ferrooxidans TaxID=920 RepID=UPI000A7D7CB3|nr:DUF29 domain-containing protein [Acidithiobacillus ferrooxidans]
MTMARHFEQQPKTNLYEADFLAWAEGQAEALRARQVGALDWVNLLEEVESMGASQRRELKNRMRVLLMHLIKWHWQPERRGSSWGSSIDVQRYEMADLFDTSPSLRREAADVVSYVWPQARKEAAKETGISPDVFPELCPWEAEKQILLADWLPE